MLEISYPVWSYLLVLGVALLISAVLYFRNTFEENKGLTYLLFFLRSLGVLLILLLLLNPFLSRSENQEQKARVLFLQDNTQSVLYKSDTTEQIEYKEELGNFLTQIKNKYPVDAYTFGEKVQTLDFDHLNFDEKSTDIREGLEYVSSLHQADYVGALVIATDGIHNRGANPAYFRAKGDYPVYVLALGDTTPIQDIRIHQILYNEIVRKDETSEIQIDVAGNFKQNKPIQIDLQEMDENRWRTISTQSYQPDQQGEFFKTFTFEKNYPDPGIHRLRALIRGVESDDQPQNNTREFFVEVLETARKIHIVSIFPHPDIGALREILEQNTNNEVEVSITERSSDLPDIQDFDILIVYQINHLKPYLTKYTQDAIEEKKGVILTAGLKTQYTTFNHLQDLVQIQPKTQSPNIVSSKFNSSFDLFDISEETENYIRKFPPLTGIFGDYNIIGQGQALLYQEIGEVETEYPIIFTGTQNGNRMGIITVEGLWKWRLFEYLEKQETPAFNEILDKVIDYVSQEKDDRLFRLRKNKLLFDETEEITFQAELYNETLERINDPDVFFELIDSSGNISEYTFDKLGMGYHLNLGRLTPGNYSYRATTTTGGKNHEEQGEFSVRSIDIELHDLQADHQTLNVLAVENQGKVFYDFQELKENLETDTTLKPILIESRVKSAMIDWKWIFGIIIFIFTAEWVIRRYYGSY